MREIEKSGQVFSAAVGMTRVRQSCARVPQLVEEGVDHGFNRGQALRRSVLEQLGDEIDRVGLGFAEHLTIYISCVVFVSTFGVANLVEWMGFDLGEFVLHVVGIHGTDLVTGGRSQHFDDLYELINARLAGKQRLSQHELRHDTSG